LSEFFSLYSHDFVRIACCVPRTRVADAAYNLAETLRLAAEGDKARTAIMVFPELGLSSYAIEDLLLQDALLDEVEASIAKVVSASNKLFPVLIVGAPLRLAGRLYNTAVVIHRGVVLGVVPKTYLPNYREFYEKRHFVSGANIVEHRIKLAGQDVPFGTDMLFRSTGAVDVTFHVEICEDIWVPVPPSSHAALAGAEVLVNLSASNITIGKAEARRLLCGSQSARAIAAYAYSASGPGESTTDLAWDGHAAIYECGDQLAETTRFEKESTIVRADVDLGRIRQERLRNNGFADCAAGNDTETARTPPWAFPALALIDKDTLVTTASTREKRSIRMHGVYKSPAKSRIQLVSSSQPASYSSTQALFQVLAQLLWRKNESTHVRNQMRDCRRASMRLRHRTHRQGCGQSPCSKALEGPRAEVRKIHPAQRTRRPHA